MGSASVKAIAMRRIFISLSCLLVLASAPGCIAVKAADMTLGVAGSAVGTAANVVEGAVELATPDRKDRESLDRERSSRNGEQPDV